MGKIICRTKRPVQVHEIDSMLFFSACCAWCGRTLTLRSDEHKDGTDCLCKLCAKSKQVAKKLEQRKARIEKHYGTKNRKLVTAINRISKMTDIKRYKEAIAQVEQVLHTDGWFNSTEEIMTAIELLRNDITIYHQENVFKSYKVDFIIPEHKIILEVDGILYHSGDKCRQDEERDCLIQCKLGMEWDIIRVTDRFVNDDITQLIPYIESVSDKHIC